MTKVSIVKGPKKPNSSWTFKIVMNAVDLVGSLDSIIKEGNTVALKYNVLLRVQYDVGCPAK